MSNSEHFYSASDICKIVKECSKSGVSQILLPQIEIFFGKKQVPDQELPIIHDLSVEDQPQGNETPEKAEVQSIIAETKLDTMHLVDPEQWEKSELMEMDQDEARR